MPSNLIDQDEFTEPVVVPSDADPATAASVIQGFQPLANRTRYLKNRVDGHDAAIAARVVSSSAWFAITGSVADDAKFTLTKRGEVGSSFDVTSNEVVFDAPGTYLVLAKGEFTNEDNKDGALYGFSVDPVGGATVHGGRALDYRRSTQEAEVLLLSTVAVVTIGDPENDRISVTAINFESGNVGAVGGIPEPCLLLVSRL